MATTSFHVPENATISQLLDQGADSLLYFEHFEPRYRRAFQDLPTGFADYKTLHKRYYEQNGLNEDKLRHTADALKDILGATRAQSSSQQGTAERIGGAWQGDAASAALGMLGQQLRLANADIKVVEDAWHAFNEAPSALRKAVKIKADKVLYILENGIDVKIDGKTPGDVDVIISGAQGFGWSTAAGDQDLGRIERIFPDLPQGFNDSASRGVSLISALPFITDDGLLMPGSPYEKKIKERCQGWLEDVFKGDYLDKTNKLVDACNKTDEGVKRVYDEIIKALRQVSEERYPCPGGVPKSTSPPGPPGPPGPGTPGPGTSTVPATTTQSPETTTVPTTTTTSNPLQGLATLTQAAQQLSPLAQNLGQGLTALGTTVKEGVDNAIEELRKTLDPKKTEDKDGDGKPDDKKDKPLAEFDLGGKHMKVEIGPDGQPKLVMTDADGKTHEYSVKLDEKGIPIISTDEPKVEDGAPAAPGDTPAPDTNSKKPEEDTQAREENPAGRPGTVPGIPPAGKREEDGENTPQPMPEGNPQPEEPADSGAKLAEAGPL